MVIFKFATDVQSLVRKIREKKSSIGFVPTMGALHYGHLSLIEKSRSVCDITVCSIFINPTQFNNADDFNKYPVTIENDIYVLEKNGCDILFMPDVREMYPSGVKNKTQFDLGYLENILEGKFRPGHFQGVSQVVKHLLEIVTPTHLFMGQKDYQQCMVIKRLLQLMALNINLVITPTLREENGLAMSSRNIRLSDDEKQKASAIYKTLLSIKQNIQPGPLIHLKTKAVQALADQKFKVDYVEIADADNLMPVSNWDGETKLVALIAAFCGDVRLIDNMLLAD